MKHFFFHISILFSVSVTGQSVDQIMSKATCDCFSHLLNVEYTNSNYFKNCFLNSIGKDTVLLKKENLKMYGDLTAESAFKFGNDYFQRNSVDLVYTCDNYFHTLDTTRFLLFNGLNKDSIRHTIELMNKTDSFKWNKGFLEARGLYYLVLEDYSSSLNDLNASLAIDSSAVSCLYFKAFIFEIKGNYDDAINLYIKLATMTSNNDFNVFAAIAKRKKNRL